MKKTKADHKVKRGCMFWDIETRTISDNDYCMVGNNKCYYIDAVILHVAYKPYKGDIQYIKFTTNDINNCCRQFIDWLRLQNKNGKYYHAFAHNGGNFDMYFLTKEFNTEEFEQYKPLLRGKTIIELKYGDNIFRDTYCFLPYSLSKLSTDYKVECPKLKEFVINDKAMTSEQICFYKPELSLKEFLKLEHTEPEYWESYNEYCRIDCLALSQIYEKFGEGVKIY